MSTPKQKKDDFEALFKGFLKGKLLYQNCENLLTNHYRSLDAAAPIRFTMFSCKRNSITHAAAAPSNLDAATSMRSADTELQKHNRTTHNSIRNCTSKTGSRRQSRKKTILKHFLKGFLKGKLLPWKLRKSTRKSLSQPGCSHSNTIYDVQLQKTIVLRMQPRYRATLSTQGVVLRLPPQKHRPCNIHAAITMRSATTASGNA